jgi:hypothetical protein
MAAVALPRLAGATTADDLCMPSADPCTVTTTVAVTPNSTIDVGSRTLEVANKGVLDLISGTMTLNAGTLTVDVGGILRARGSATAPGGKIIAMAGAIAINGSIDATGAPGGDVSLTSTGPLMLNGTLDVHSRSGTNGGGTAALQGTDVTITGVGHISAVGGPDDFGGSVDVSASGALSVGAGIDVTGGDGGEIALSADGALSIAAGVTLDADATTAGESGGDIELDAMGPVTMDGIMSVTGRNGTADSGGGDGGDLCIEGSAVNITRPASVLDASSGAPDGTGGDVQVTSDDGDVVYGGQIKVTGIGIDAGGGTISIDAAAALTFSGMINGTGGSSDGAELDMSSGSDLTISSSAAISVAASSTGAGGDISLDGGDTLDVAGDLTSDGGSAQGGTGGSMDLSACTVRIDNTATLSNLRPGGTTTLTGRDLTIVAGTMKADPGSGRNAIVYAGPANQPSILPGAHIDPPPALVQDSTVIPCSAVNTPTPTTTPGTPTPSPVACVGDCTGTGAVSISDLITGVNIALGSQPITSCPAFDVNGDGTVGINELIQGVTNALNGCP